jgi:hypothetical protein
MKTEGALSPVVDPLEAKTRMTLKDLIKKYVYYGPDIPSSRPIHIDLGHFEPNYIISYITIIVGGYFLAKDVPEFTPIITYMGVVGALILAAQILDLRKEMKKAEGPILRPRLGEMKNDI